MITPGLVSVTFRQLSPQAIIDLVVQAGLTSVEWGGDVHVPHGDVRQAQIVRRQTAEAGLQVAAYGSYYRVGHEETGPFEAVLASARGLGARVIHVWAGRMGTDAADDVYWDQVVANSRHIAELAASEDVEIVYEFHQNTLTDTNETARRLLEQVDRPNVRSFWQPPRYSKFADNLAGIQLVQPWLVNVHVFNWHKQTGARLPLADAQDEWMQYLRKVAADGRDHGALIEFVKDDDPEQFLADAVALKGWLARLT